MHSKLQDPYSQRPSFSTTYFMYEYKEYKLDLFLNTLKSLIELPNCICESDNNFEIELESTIKDHRNTIDYTNESKHYQERVKVLV